MQRPDCALDYYHVTTDQYYWLLVHLSGIILSYKRCSINCELPQAAHDDREWFLMFPVSSMPVQLFPFSLVPIPTFVTYSHSDIYSTPDYSHSLIFPFPYCTVEWRIIHRYLTLCDKTPHYAHLIAIHTVMLFRLYYAEIHTDSYVIENDIWIP